MLEINLNHIRPAVLFCVAVLFALVGDANGQDAREKGPLKPDLLSLKTRDGVQLKATYYGSIRGKEAVPVILMHDHKKNRSELDRLATMLQTSEGHAVMTVDFRGHGGSTQKFLPNGKEVTLDAAKFRPADFKAMIGQDMEAVRRFLVKENDAGKLNLNKLCLVGVGMGATIAVNWAAADWSVRPVPSGKQGQDVKAIVVVSPQAVFKGVKMTQALKQPDIQEKVAFLIVFGSRDRKARRDAEGIHKRLLRFHPEPSESDGIEKQELFIEELDTNAQGTNNRFINGGADGIDPMLTDFIKLRLVKQEFDWSKHRIGD